MNLELKKLLSRSDELELAILNLLEPATYDDDARSEASYFMCSVAHEHWCGVRTLIASDLMTSAIGLMRLQYEALVRATWLHFAADEDSIPDLKAGLPQEREISVGKMLLGIKEKGPNGAYEMMSSFKDVNWKILNSVVHAGLRPLQLHSYSYSDAEVLNIVQTSNGLATMTAMMLAIVSGDSDVISSAQKVQRPFQDCLPEFIHS